MRERLLADIPAEIASAKTSGNLMSGYASVFNYPIDSGVPSHPQTTYVMPGAFTKTLNENRDMIQVLFNHGMDPRYGQLPIGRVQDIKQDRHGLFTQVELHDGPDNENIRAALAQGALRAMSIQFEVMQQDYSDDRSERYLQQLKLWEFGPVTFPANEAATAQLHSANLWTPNSEAEASEQGDRETTSPDADRITLLLTLAARIDANRESLEKQEERWRRLGS